MATTIRCLSANGATRFAADRVDEAGDDLGAERSGHLESSIDLLVGEAGVEAVVVGGNRDTAASNCFCTARKWSIEVVSAPPAEIFARLLRFGGVPRPAPDAMTRLDLRGKQLAIAKSALDRSH